MIRQLIFLLFIAFPAILLAQTVQTDMALPYLVQQPTMASPNPPVVILMHGYGSNEADLFEFKDHIPKNFLVISVRAPISMGNNAYQWFRMETTNGVMEANTKDLQASVDKIKTMVPAMIKKYHADAARVHLSGFSQGGMMSFAVGLTAPELFRGIAPLSGKVFESVKPQVKVTPALKKLKIFIGHGDADNRVPYKSATDATQYLKGLGLSPELYTYKGMAHSISKDELNDLVHWLVK